jgi:TRAP transporter TAXI family solute receptor
MRLSSAKPRYAPHAHADAGAEAARSRVGLIRSIGVVWVLLAFALQPALAQSGAQPGAQPASPSGKPDQPPDRPQAVAQSVGLQQVLRAKLNQHTLVIAAGRPGTSYMAMAGDLAVAAGASGRLRLLPVAAEGGVANLQDLLFLRAVDLAIVPANVLAHAKATNAFGSTLSQKVAYVTALYSEGVHVVAGREIAAIGDLRGKRIGIPAGDGTVQFTAADILKRLGLGVESVPMEPADALEEVRGGTLAAVLLVGVKPMVQVSAVAKDGSLRLLSLPIQALPAEAYAPAVFLPEDYPALIPPGAIVETVAVSAVLMAHRSADEAGRRVARHMPALLTAIGALAASERHPSWRDVNIGAVLPGWVRVEAAQKWLSVAVAQRKQQLKGAPASASGPLLAQKPVKSSGLSEPNSRRKLLDEFEAWSRQSDDARSAPE